MSSGDRLSAWGWFSAVRGRRTTVSRRFLGRLAVEVYPPVLAFPLSLEDHFQALSIPLAKGRSKETGLGCYWSGSAGGEVCSEVSWSHYHS